MAGQEDAGEAPWSGEPGSPDVGRTLARACLVARESCGLSGVAVSVMTDGVTMIVGCSDESFRRIESLQFDLGEGPGIDAFASGETVLVPDLAADAARWPVFASTALGRGVAAIHTVPLRLGSDLIGVVSCYVDRPRALEAVELAEIERFSVLAAGLLAVAVVDQPGGGADLPGALDLRSEVFQAQGMTMVQLGVGLEDALARMRAHAFVTGVDLLQLSLAILDGSVRLERDGT